MKKIFLICLMSLFLITTLCSQENNDFYDNTQTFSLNGPKIHVNGEVENPGLVDFSKLKKHSVMVREAKYESTGEVEFVGAYRYDGYSLFDVLKERYVDKKNKQEFDSVIDLVVVVENKSGEKVVLSWGEIYYATELHQTLIATHVSPILPTKTEDQWPIPQETRLICGNDLLTVRNIEHPTKITVLSQPLSFEINREISPLYSDKIGVYKNKKCIDLIQTIKKVQEPRSYPSVFYGRGKGFHGVQNFTGKPLKSVLSPYFQVNEQNLRSGFFCVSAKDGYRITLSFSEIFNRNDNNDFLLIDQGKGEEGGRFRIFPSPDFFSDRAVKAINEIHFMVY
ncbi:MAG: hypothetical protein GF421_04610 [Candidatus Aminicenantes bacterium]|nr:hypothetical protein [Candidatus Aminicenantes bacterium]